MVGYSTNVATRSSVSGIEGIGWLVCSFSFTSGSNVVSMSVCTCVVCWYEVPKGLMLIALSWSTCSLWRGRLRCPDMLHIVILQVSSCASTFSDVVAIIGSIDVVFGSVDLICYRC